MANLTTLFSTLITAFHILSYNKVIDAYGHISFRNPQNGSQFYMSRNLAPALVSSTAYFVLYAVADASPIDPNAPLGFIERPIHSSIYNQYSGVNYDVYSHSPDVVPYTLSEVPIMVMHPTASFLSTKLWRLRRWG